MLNIFCTRRTKSSLEHHARPKSSPPTGPVKERSSALKIIYAGGVIEYHYMAVPAARIIEKNPSFILARPDVFRRPWDAVVLPEEMLIPGQKYFLVPTSTAKKLRRRIGKNCGMNVSMTTSISHSSIDASSEIVSQEKDSRSSKSFSKKSNAQASSIMSKASGKLKACNHRVRFFGIECKEGSDSFSSETKKKAKDVHIKSSNVHQSSARKSRGRNAVTWQATLTSILENYGGDE